MVLAAGVAAVVTGGFGLIGPHVPVPSLGDILQGDASIIVASGVQGTTIINQYAAPESPTREAIAALERKLEDAGRQLELQRSDIQLLMQALKDLDERTSGMEKLPDGRTRFGNIVSGAPTVVLEAHAAAVALYGHGQYEKALRQSRVAITALEGSEVEGVAMWSGSLAGEDRAKIYRVAGLSAQRMGLVEEALAWAQKAVALSRSPETLSLLVAALANDGRRDEAIGTLAEAVASFPDAPALLSVQRQLLGAQ
jgi:tetratricopeptide (TPR) repeat protein